MSNNMEPRTSNSNRGFTLIELMIVVVVIGILAAIGIANYKSAKEKSIDASMKSDLRGAMVFIEDYNIQNEELPADLSAFETATNYKLSPGVEWAVFNSVVTDGEPALELQLQHPASPNEFFANYPMLQRIQRISP